MEHQNPARETGVSGNNRLGSTASSFCRWKKVNPEMCIVPPGGRARARTWVPYPPQQSAQGHFFIPGAASSRGGYITQAASSSIGITLHSSEMQNLGLAPEPTQCDSARSPPPPPEAAVRLTRSRMCCTVRPLVMAALLLSVHPLLD